MDPLRLKVNVTTTFMLPLLYKSGLKHSDILTDTFIDAYIADIDKPNNDNKLLIRYAHIHGLPEWIDDQSLYEAEDDSWMVTHEIPDEFADEYTNFLIGDYSKFSKEYKNQVLHFWEANEDTLLYGVLNRTGEEIKQFLLEVYDIDTDVISREAEYWKPPDLKQEIFGMREDE